MASNSTLFYTLLAYVCLTIISTCHCHDKTPKFPAILIFGDSTVDTGNNNYILTLFKANHHPYGVDFPGHVATGRFSNGRLVPDLLASALGIKELVPPFLEPVLSDDDIRTGVSFASGGSGFDDLTTVASGVIPVSHQLAMFEEYVHRLKKIVGEEEASKIIRNALILISAGTNDLVFNWYNLPSRRFHFDSVGGYHDFLQGKLHELIKEIYKLGGRKFAVAGLAPIGCLPFQIAASLKNHFHQTCVEEQNSDAVAYNSKLEKLLPQVEESLQGSKIILFNYFDAVMDMISHPHKYGFLEASKGCCGVGLLAAGPICNILTPACVDPSKFIFWDSVHPTEAVYKKTTSYIIDHVLPKLHN